MISNINLEQRKSKLIPIFEYIHSPKITSPLFSIKNVNSNLNFIPYRIIFQDL